MKTQVLISDSFEPFLNLAVEDWLFEHCDADTVTLYLWRNERTVVIGRNQNPYAECRVELLEGEGGHLMRRTTGGGAVYHDAENLNFTFVTPAAMADTRRNFDVVAEALSAYGIVATVSGRNDMQCDGRKFSGSAFHKNATTALHHGTVMIRTDIDMLRRYLTPDLSKLSKHGVQSVESRVVNLAELADVTVDNLVPAMIVAFQSVFGQEAVNVGFDNLASLSSVRQRRDFYASDEWRFGRWRDFKATCKGSFEWGTVEVSLLCDGPSIKDCRIASDALDTEAVDEARRLLLSGRWTAGDRPCANKTTTDILNLISKSVIRD